MTDFLSAASSESVLKSVEKESERSAAVNEIPRIVHFCFIDWQNMPENYLGWVSNWPNVLGPDWVFVNWCPQTTDPSHPLEQWWIDNNRRAFYADWQRIHKVAEYGGFYLDCDVDLHKTLEPLRDLDYCFDTEAITSFPEFGVFGAKKNNRFMMMLKNAYDNSTPDDYISNPSEFLIGRFCRNALMHNGITVSFSAKNPDELRQQMTAETQRIMWCMNSTQLSNPKGRIDRVLVPYNPGAYSTHCFTGSWTY